MHVADVAKLIAIVFLAGGLAGCVISIWWAGNGEEKKRSRAQVLGSISAGLFTGAGVAVGVLLLQQWMTDANAAAVWRANVQTAASIPGLTEAYSLKGLVLSGKDLHDAYLQKAHLEGLLMEDTNLKGAQLQGAYLQGADLIGADLSTAELANANLSGAKLQAADFGLASSVEQLASLAGAQASAKTCWPYGFLESPIAREITAEPSNDGQGHTVTIPGHEYPHCLPRTW